MLLDRERLTPELIETLAPEEREGLRTLRAAQEYARRIGLSPSTSYRHLIDRDVSSAVQVVVASPPDRLEPVSWWFPIVGRITYRGYFDRARAQRFANDLAGQGLDTYVRPALLYSTLGYFDDPLPRGVLRWDPIDLSDVVVHELVHATVFVGGQSNYNEALASFIAEKAVLQMLEDDPEARLRAEAIFADRATYAALLDDLARDLEALYARVESPEQALEARAPLLRRYQEEVYPSLPWRTDRYEGFTRAALSNAFVVAQRTYSGELPCLQAEYEALAEDLEAFVRAHRERPGPHAVEGIRCDLTAPE